MKKFILVPILMLALGCSKSNDNTNVNINNTSTKWVITQITDSLFASGKFTGTNNYSVASNPDTLKFNPDNTGTSFKFGDFTYTSTEVLFSSSNTPVPLYATSGTQIYLFFTDKAHTYREYYYYTKE